MTQAEIAKLTDDALDAARLAAIRAKPFNRQLYDALTFETNRRQPRRWHKAEQARQEKLL